MEHQNVEYKQSWRDEYVKWICGFANAKGGIIYIGIDDAGNVTGIDDAKKLLEDIPNKTRDILGIIVDVNIKTKAKKQYLEIIVESYPFPVSYKGQYHFRSGSTKQELKGAALDKFILNKQGKRWDAVPRPFVTVKDLSKPAFDTFKRLAADTKRIDGTLLKDRPDVLLDKLYLKTDNGYLKNAAVLLFHADAEKYVTGAYIKVGFFEKDDADLVFQDEVHGYLFNQVEKAMALLLTKYLKAQITYKKLQRIETYPIPVPALREALLNAIVHKDYQSGNPIQISVYNDKLIIWNEGELPANWTVAKLKDKHSSRPYNPDIAHTFFRAGLIEAWGRGTTNMLIECRKAKALPPNFSYDQLEQSFWVQFNYPPIKPEVTIKIQNSNISTSNKVINLIKQNEQITIAELATKIGVAEVTIKRMLKTLQNDNKIKREGSDKAGIWLIVK